MTRKVAKTFRCRNPDRSFYLSGRSETNRREAVRPEGSALTLCLHGGASCCGMRDITFFQRPEASFFRELDVPSHTLLLTCFLSPREIKELGAQTIQINNPGPLEFLSLCLHLCCLYTGDGLMKWEYRGRIAIKSPKSPYY